MVKSPSMYNKVTTSTAKCTKRTITQHEVVLIITTTALHAHNIAQRILPLPLSIPSPLSISKIHLLMQFRVDMSKHTYLQACKVSELKSQPQLNNKLL